MDPLQWLKQHTQIVLIYCVLSADTALILKFIFLFDYKYVHKNREVINTQEMQIVNCVIWIINVFKKVTIEWFCILYRDNRVGHGPGTNRIWISLIQMAIFSLKLIFKNNIGFKGAIKRGNLFLQLAKNGFEWKRYCRLELLLCDMQCDL